MNREERERQLGKGGIEMAENKEYEWLEITITASLRLERTWEVILPKPLLKQSHLELLPRNVLMALISPRMGTPQSF